MGHMVQESFGDLQRISNRKMGKNFQPAEGAILTRKDGKTTQKHDSCQSAVFV